MSCRHGCILLTMVAGLAPLGCAHWQPCWMREDAVKTEPAQPPATLPPPDRAEGELTPLQAAQLCLAAGESLQKKGYAAEAIQQYENARTHDPQAPVARRLAVLYDLQGDNAHAEAEYVRALQEQPNDAELLNDLGYFHYRHDRPEVAESWLRKAVAVNPDCGCAWTNLGQVLAHRGRLEDSYQAFAHVLRPAEAYSNLGVVLAKQGRITEARQSLQKALSLDPTLKQPQAFLKALPPAPALLPPGITRHSSDADSAVNVDDMPTIIVPKPSPAPRAALAPSPKPVAALAAPPREVAQVPAPPRTASRTPALLPAPDTWSATPMTPAPAPAPRPFEAPVIPVACTLPAPVKTAPAPAPLPPPPPPPTPASAPKVDDGDLPIILSACPQPKPVSTYTPPSAAPKTPPTNAMPPTAPKTAEKKPTPPAAPKILPPKAAPPVIVPVPKPTPRAVLIDCSAPQDNPQP